MGTPLEDIQPDSVEAEIVDLSAHVLETVRSVLGSDAEEAAGDFRHLLGRIRKLIQRKASFEASKGETRDLLAEVLFSRLSRSFRTFYQNAEVGGDPLRAAEFLLGSVLTGAALSDFANVMDRVITEEVVPDYHLAGRADFISLEELFQLLSAGKHTGMLTLESKRQKLDLHFLDGLIAFIDPQRLDRRVLPGKRPGSWREVSEELCDRVNEGRTARGLPILLGLLEEGFLKPETVKTYLRSFGAELIYEFLLDPDDCAFRYKAITEIPDFVQEHHAGLPVMPVLLEGHKRIDDWRRIRRVFPDLHEQIVPAPDLFRKIAELPLAPIELKVLSLLTGKTSFVDVQAGVGLSRFDLGLMLVHFASDGILEPPGGKESLFDDAMSTEESLEAATEALEMIESMDSIPDSLDAVFGDEEEGFGLGYVKAARKDKRSEKRAERRGKRSGK